MSPPVPPIAVITISPSLAPLHDISVAVSLVMVIAIGSFTIKLLLNTGKQPLASVTVTV